MHCNETERRTEAQGLDTGHEPFGVHYYSHRPQLPISQRMAPTFTSSVIVPKRRIRKWVVFKDPKSVTPPAHERPKGRPPPKRTPLTLFNCQWECSRHTFISLNTTPL